MWRQPIQFELVRIPRWTIQREALPPRCPDCDSAIIRVRADCRHMFFCECRFIADAFIPDRARTRSLPGPSSVPEQTD